MKKAFFLTLICYLFCFIVFLLCLFGFDYCVDNIGPDPECTDIQLAYFGVGILFFPLIGSGVAMLRTLFEPILARLSTWLFSRFKKFVTRS